METYLKEIMDIFDKKKKLIYSGITSYEEYFEKVLYDPNANINHYWAVMIKDAAVSKLNLPSIKMSGVNFIKVVFENINFSNSSIYGDFKKSHWINVNFANSMMGGQFEEGLLEKVNFTNCCLRSNFESTKLINCDFSNANCHDAEFRMAELSSVKFINANLTDCDFSFTKFNNVILKNIIISDNEKRILKIVKDNHYPVQLMNIYKEKLAKLMKITLVELNMWLQLSK